VGRAPKLYDIGVRVIMTVFETPGEFISAYMFRSIYRIRSPGLINPVISGLDELGKSTNMIRTFGIWIGSLGIWFLFMFFELNLELIWI